MTRFSLLATCMLLASAVPANEVVELGSRPLMLVEDMDEGPLKHALQQCAGRRPEATSSRSATAVHRSNTPSTRANPTKRPREWERAFSSAM